MENKESGYIDYLLGGKELLNEEVKSVDSIIKKIEKLTDENNHTESRLVIAKDILHDKKYAKVLDAITEIHEFFGHMPSGLIEVRTEITNQMLEEAKKKLSDDEYKSLKGAL